jgi:hypothetical protein
MSIESVNDEKLTLRIHFKKKKRIVGEKGIERKERK